MVLTHESLQPPRCWTYSFGRDEWYDKIRTTIQRILQYVWPSLQHGCLHTLTTASTVLVYVTSNFKL